MASPRLSGHPGARFFFWLVPAFISLIFIQPAVAADFAQIQETSARVVRILIFSLELAGIGVIVLGVLISSFFFLTDILGRRDPVLGYHDFRTKLGRAILLGLEFLVAADIINTVAIDPTLENLGTLAIIISIRVLLSFALEVEIEGRWPWQRGSRPNPE